MKIQFFFLIGWISMLTILNVQAQQFEWGNAIPGLPATPWKICATISADGYVVAGGYFINSSGNDQPFLTRINPQGTTEWVNIFETASSCYIEAVAIHEDGSIRVGGWAGPDSDIDPGPGVHIIPGLYNGFLAAFNADGTFVDVDTFGKGKVLALHIDQDNNLLLTGNMTFNQDWDMDLGPGKYFLTPAAQSSSELVLAKYNPAGQLLWATQTYGQEITPGYSSILSMHLGTDELGHVFVGGHFSGQGATIRFKLGANPIQVATSLGTDLFVARFQSSNGVAEWVRIIRGKNYDNTLRTMAVRYDGQVAIGGGFRDTATIIDPSGNHIKLAPYPSTTFADDIFMVTYNVQGQVQWGHALIGSKSEFAGGLSWTQAGDLWMFGKLGTATIDFDPGVGVHDVTSFGLYLARYSDDGKLHWVYTIPADYPFLVIPYGADGFLTASRTNTNGADFDLTPYVQMVGQTQARGVLVRYNDCDILWSEANATLCPDKVLDLDGIIIDTAGIFTGVLVSQEGCDSVLTLMVTQMDIDTSVQVGDASLLALGLNASYQWWNCDTDMPVAGATNALFNPTLSGHYSVIVTQNSCSDTSTCYPVTIVNSEESDLTSVWKIWPIPARENAILSKRGESNGPIRVEIWSTSGVLYQEFEILPSFNSVDFSVESMVPGFYVLRIHEGHQTLNVLPLVITR